MLTVWCVCTGTKYSEDKVHNLKRMVEKNLTVDHVFICLTDKLGIDGVRTIHLPYSYGSWWDKINIFNEADGPAIYLDLDTVIVGNINHLHRAAQTCKLAAAANWGQSGHGGIQSSVMAWDGTLREPYDHFDYEVDSKRFHGDQCFLTELYGNSYTKLNGIYSYKYHCRHELPKDAAVVCFHGKPDYWEVNDTWIQSALS